MVFFLHSGLLLSTPFEQKKSSDSIMLGLCCLFGLSFGNVGWSPIKMWAKNLEKSTTRGAGSYVNFSARCPSTRQNHDLNCLFWGMWPEEFLGLTLGFSDFTQGYLPPAPPHICKSAVTKMECNRIKTGNNFLNVTFKSKNVEFTISSCLPGAQMWIAVFNSSINKGTN